MTEEFMDNIWLRGIQRSGVMSNVLSRVEHSESKSIKEFSLGQKATNWLKSPSSSALKELGDGL
jgi:hypothetical protein